jgi:hypothetical protein
MMLLQLSHEYYSHIANNEFTFPLKCRAYRMDLEIIVGVFCSMKMLLRQQLIVH